MAMSRDPTHKFHGEARSVSDSTALILHDVSLFSPCSHITSEPVAQCGFCCLWQSQSTRTTLAEQPCDHSTSNEDCEECRLSNPLAAHAIRELALLTAGQFICLLPKSHMALVVRPAQSQLLGTTESYLLEHCLLVPLQDSVVAEANYWDALLALPLCDIALV